jgi:hypothetical protein
MIATIILMGASTTFIGLIPSYASIGVWAPAEEQCANRAGNKADRPGGKTGEQRHRRGRFREENLPAAKISGAPLSHAG